MNILITGAGSYIGESVAKYIQEREKNWDVYQLDMMTESWKEHDFSSYDVIYHVAGLAHRKITPEIEPLYYKVNRDLAIEVAYKAKISGIKHFIFMSSMSVYSDAVTRVDIHTPTEPDNAYGKSKLQAEEKLKELDDSSFIVSIIRPPMIYGKGCKGNYNSLRKIALKSPVFPKVNNKRSMLYIDNLSEFVLQLVKKPMNGIFFPQNEELVNTTEWVKNIAAVNGKKIRLSSLLGLFAMMGKHIPGIRGYCIKAFGDSYYDLDMSRMRDIDYQLVSFINSIRLSEKAEEQWNE